MSERGFTGVFLAALMVGVVATVGVYRLVLENRSAGLADEVTTVPVVVAVADISEGGLIAPEILRVRQFNKEAVPKGAFTEVDSVAGRVARLPIFDGEPVLEHKLAPIGAGAGLEVKISAGKRAMAIPVNDHVGLSGLIQPNSRVDVLVTLRPDSKSRPQRTAKLFLQNMRVLSVGTQLVRGEDGKPITASTVTLEVDPTEAEMLAVAMNEGVLQLALRGFADADSIKTGGATAGKVLAAGRTPQPRKRRPTVIRRTTPDPKPEPKPETPVWMKVQIYRGSQMTEQEVERDSVKAEDDKAGQN